MAMAIIYNKSIIDDQEVIISFEVDKLPAQKGPYDDEDFRGEGLKKAIETARDMFAEGMALIRSCAIKAVHGIEKLDKKFRPDEMELKIGINVDSEVGAIIAKSGAGAQLEVTMKWNTSKKQ
jgi:hypothetical protein